jgi:cardiolipin synthase
MATAAASHRWFRSGGEFFRELLARLGAAQRSIRLEFYIFAPDAAGQSVRDALVTAAQRGVNVRVLVDAFGSGSLPADFWKPLRAGGGEVKVFNPLKLFRLAIRNHRKLLVVDDEFAAVGGFNIADEYTGDGITTGWADCGFSLTGPAVPALARNFDELFAQGGERQPQAILARLRKGVRPPPEDIAPGVQLLMSGPGRKPNAFQKLLRPDVEKSRHVQFVSAYFLPGYRMRRLLRRGAKSGSRIQIIVPGKSDVPLAQRAARHLYAGLLRAGVEIWEYEPQVLHTKLFLANEVAYVGSSNLDTRSLHLNYELMLRLTDPAVVAGARDIFAGLLTHSRRVDPTSWHRSRSWWEKLREQWAYWLLSRVDPYVTRWLGSSPR